MREIALDTETTGLSVAFGDRITEIGCVEIVDKKITGKEFHTYVNPEREVAQAAYEISGLNYAFLKKHKLFKAVGNDLLDFIGDDKLIIHNAPFDVGFLNAEFALFSDFVIDKARVVDTLTLARQKYPGARASLDALCKKFSIDNSSRTKHGALIDAQLLAEVYIHMSVEFLQKDIFAVEPNDEVIEAECAPKIYIAPREHLVNHVEQAAHEEILRKIKNPIWNDY